MKRFLKKSFIPHEENNHVPHILRGDIILIGGAIILALFVFLQSPAAYLSKLRASILPVVLVDLANEDRGVNNLPPLLVNPLLAESAQMKADDMVKNSYFAHTSPEGIAPWHWFSESGYEFDRAGENLASGFFESREVEEAWMNSITHRENILNKNFTEIGIAAARGIYQGKETIFVVQHFGFPKVDSVIKSEEVISFSSVEGAEETIPAVAGVQIAQVEEVSETFIEIVAPEEDVITENEIEGINQSTPTEKFVSSPKKALTITYVFFGFLLALGIIFVIISDIKSHQYKHLVYGGILILIIVTLLLITWFSRAPELNIL